MTISRNAVAARRTQVLQKFTADDLIILVASPESQRNADTKYLYRQDSYHYYLTGFEEPRSLAILAPGRAEGQFILFNLPNDPAKEIWTGKRAGQQGAVENYGADQSFSIEDLASQLPAILRGRKNVYIQAYAGERSVEEKTVLRLMAEAGAARCDILPLLTAMRSIKDQSELARMRQAIAITGEAHVSAMRHCQPGMFEYQLEAHLMKKFYMGGSHAQAYPNIVASGPNACTLHYETNTRQIADGDLVLIDAAAEYDTYAADITRTFPANGKFSEEQRAIYEIVLRAQQAGILAVAPGVTVKAVRDAVEREMTKGLLQIGLLNGDLEELIKNFACGKFFKHSFGHWIGLDVHDVGSKDKDGQRLMREFEPGMTLTMEPGIYIPDTLSDVPAKWHNIGVRIEDVLLVTNNGCEVMSADIPKQVADIEGMMAYAKLHRMSKHRLFHAPEGNAASGVEASACQPPISFQHM